MKHTSFKNALFRALSVLMLLNMGIMPIHAQYYMNVFTKDGQKTRFAVTDVDSVTYTAIPVPTTPGYVSKITMSYIENYPTNVSFFDEESVSISFGYDSQNRITSMYAPDGNFKLDYSKSGCYIITTDSRDTLTCHLDNSGFVSSIESDRREIKVERDGDYTSRLIIEPKVIEQGVNNIQNIDFIHQEGVLTGFVVDNQSLDFLYRYGYPNPLLNIDINWFGFGGLFYDFVPLLFGYCGKLSDKLLEIPPAPYSEHHLINIPDDNVTPAGTYHFEEKYNRLNTNESDVIIDYNDDGYPASITYLMSVEEYIHSYDYEVVVDTIGYYDHGTKGELETGKVLTRHRSSMVPGTDKSEPTGVIVGTNEFVCSFDYNKK